MDMWSVHPEVGFSIALGKPAVCPVSMRGALHISGCNGQRIQNTKYHQEE